MSLQVQENNENFLSKIETMQKCVKSLMQTKHYQALGEAGIFAILQKAESLGMPQMEALNGGLYVVNGKVGMSTESMASMIRSKGHSIIKDPKSNDGVCILHGKRADNGDTWTVSFSVEDAKRAGLFKGVFEKYQAVMCYNRACSMLARQLFPDIIKGAGYTMDELKEIAESKSNNFTSPAIEIHETKSEPMPVEIIDFGQAAELMDILEECDPAYRAKVLAFIKLPPHNAQNVYELPVSLYQKFKTGALNNRAEQMIANKAKESQSVVEIQEIKE